MHHNDRWSGSLSQALSDELTAAPRPLAGFRETGSQERSRKGIVRRKVGEGRGEGKVREVMEGGGALQYLGQVYAYGCAQPGAGCQHVAAASSLDIKQKVKQSKTMATSN